MAVTNSPAYELASNDPGDDISRRFRYQWTWAAIACCTLLDKSQNIAEVFCEHHEDILLRHKDGSYSGLQIKTKNTGEDGWTTGDEAVKKSFAKFCKLEETYPNQFSSFKFLSNHPIRSSNNGKDLKYVIAEIIKHKNTSAKLANPIQTFLNTIARIANCDILVARQAIEKSSADDSLPKLADVDMRLISTLTSEGIWPRASDLLHASITRVAKYLVYECGRASSLAHEGTLPGYLPITSHPIDEGIKARIEGKRIDIDKLLIALENGLSDTLPLDGPPDRLPELGKGSNALLRAKLDAGGFSAITLNSASDLRDKAEYLGIVWTQKHGQQQGLQRYSHIRTLVLADAATAFEVTKNTMQPMGLSMRTALRKRFNERQTDKNLKPQLYECTNEHLEGVAYSLTSECQVQWSIDRPWENEE